MTFDAVFAFMALWFAKTPAVRQFGSLMVIGIIAVCVCSIILTLAILGIREYKSPTKGKDFSKGRLSRLVVWLGSLPSKSAIPLAAAAAVIFLGGIAVEGKLTLQTDPIQWLNPGSHAVQQIETLKAATGSSNQIGVVIHTDHPFSQQTVDYVAKLADTETKKYGADIFPGAGLVASIDEFLTVRGTNDVHPTGAQIEGIYLLAPPAIRKTMVAQNGHDLNMIFLARSNELSNLQAMIDNLHRDNPPPPGITVAAGGIGVVGVGLLHNLDKSRTLMTYLALVFVGAFLAVRLRSLIRSLLSLVPVLVAVGAVSLIAVAFNIKLSPVTAVSGPLVVAVCTEFTSLILLRFVEERNRGLNPRDAMTVTAARTGRAFMVSGMTAVAGIGVIATSSMPMLRDFGLVVGMNVAVALDQRVGRPPAGPGLGRRPRLGVSGPDQAEAGTLRIRQARTTPAQPRRPGRGPAARARLLVTWRRGRSGAGPRRHPRTRHGSSPSAPHWSVHCRRPSSGRSRPERTSPSSSSRWGRPVPATSRDRHPRTGPSAPWWRRSPGRSAPPTRSTAWARTPLACSSRWQMPTTSGISSLRSKEHWRSGRGSPRSSPLAYAPSGIPACS